MTAEQVKAQVLAECGRLWQLRKDSDPNSTVTAENPKNFIEGLWPISVTPEDVGWKLGPQYGHNAPFTPIGLRPDCDANHIVWQLAYRFLGLQSKDTRWEKLKAELKARNEAEIESIRDNAPPMGYPPVAKDIAYAVGCVYGWIEGTMTRIEEQEDNDPSLGRCREVKRQTDSKRFEVQEWSSSGKYVPKAAFKYEVLAMELWAEWLIAGRDCRVFDCSINQSAAGSLFKRIETRQEHHSDYLTSRMFTAIHHHRKYLGMDCYVSPFQLPPGVQKILVDLGYRIEKAQTVHFPISKSSKKDAK